MKEVQLRRTWVIGDQLGQGGFGKVFAADCGYDRAAAKFVPKVPGGDRDLLLEDLGDVPNVMPIIDSGETDEEWVIVMPRAEHSLRDTLEAEDAPGDGLAVKVLNDVMEALEHLDGRVVHRDIKPENVLQYEGVWCLADFGIARYAEATTAVATQKFAMTPAYAAPERWRSERAKTAADVYSLGAAEIERRSAADVRASVAVTEAEQQDHLFNDAEHSLRQILDELQTTITTAAPNIEVTGHYPKARCLKLGTAQLRLSPIHRPANDPWEWQAPAFNVVAAAEISLEIPPTHYGYHGRSHSLWFSDCQTEDEFAWFETAFMISPMMSGTALQNPFALEPGEKAAKAVWNGMAEFQVAWPFTRLVTGDLTEFVDRWASWFAQAAAGTLSSPTKMPEQSPQGSWRKT